MPTTSVTGPTLDAVQAALATVDDPEIHRPITDLDMVKAVASATAAWSRSRSC